MSEKTPINLGGRVEKISVSDQDALDWIKTLVEAGLPADEIDRIMSHLNETYREKIKKGEIEKELRKIKEDLMNRKGYIISPEEELKIKQGIASRYK